jgi:hypothetical protein
MFAMRGGERDDEGEEQEAATTPVPKRQRRGGTKEIKIKNTLKNTNKSSRPFPLTGFLLFVASSRVCSLLVVILSSFNQPVRLSANLVMASTTTTTTTSSSPSTSTQSQIDRFVEQGKVLIDQGQYEDAIDSMQCAMELVYVAMECFVVCLCCDS